MEESIENRLKERVKESGGEFGGEFEKECKGESGRESKEEISHTSTRSCFGVTDRGVNSTCQVIKLETRRNRRGLKRTCQSWLS